MKVLLINPGKSDMNYFAIHEPLNLCFLAAYLLKHNKNIKIKIFDQLAGGSVFRMIDKFSPDLVGVTSTTPLVPFAYQIGDYCKSKNIKSVIGGVHASVLPNEALKHFDIVVIGEGEKALLKIIQDGIKNGIVKEDYIRNLDEIPSPARNLLKMRFYLRTRDRIPGIHHHPFPHFTNTAGVITSRGCPFRCIFCHNTWRGTPVRYHSIEKVINELKELIKKYKVKAIFFFDDEFITNKNRLLELCKRIKQEKLKFHWGCQGRVDRVDEERLIAMKNAGCKFITFGFESGSQRTLDVLNKRTTVAQNINAIKICKEVGIKVGGTLMIGNPGETEKDLELTLKFLKENQIDNPGVHITTPFPGTVLWEWCKKQNLIPKTLNWQEFTTGKISVVPNKILTEKCLKKYMIEMNRIIYKRKKISFGDIFGLLYANPLNLYKKKKLIKQVCRSWFKNAISRI